MWDLRDVDRPCVLFAGACIKADVQLKDMEALAASFGVGRSAFIDLLGSFEEICCAAGGA